MNWGISRKGNPWLKTDDATITVFVSRIGPRGFGWAINFSAAEGTQFSEEVFPTADKAKTAALAAYTTMRATRGNET